MRRCFAYPVALCVAALLGPTAVATAATPLGAVVSNGTIQLGVTQWGDLNYDCAAAADTGCPAASAAGGTNVVGVRYVPLNTEATGDGCTCEGWGAADATSGLTGFANQQLGNLNLTAVGIMATATTAVVTTDVSDPAIPGYALRVVHDYHPSQTSPNLYEVTVSITNTGTHDITDLRYRRVMDWDIEPTAYAEWVTVANTAASRQLLFDSDHGFATSDPLGGHGYSQSESACGAGYSGLCDFTDLGSGGEYPAVTNPADHGALFDFGFGALATAQTRIFETYYGAAPSEQSALSAISAQGIGVYSLGEPDCGANGNSFDLCAGIDPFGGVAAGLPNTFTFGFLTADADLSVVAGAAPAAVVTGSQAAASFTVTNKGPDATPDARLTITLPAGADYVSAVPSQGSCVYTAPDVVCSLGSLASGASASVVVTARLSKGGTLALTATTSTPANDSAPGNNAASVALIASDVVITAVPVPTDAPFVVGAAPFMVQVQFRIPKSCATPCRTGAQLMLRDGVTMLGRRNGLSLTGSGHVRFNVQIDKAELQAAVGVVDHKGYRTTQTRMIVRTLGKNGKWSSVVKFGHIAVSVDRITYGGLPNVVGQVF